jgi:hypothetical protein
MSHESARFTRGSGYARFTRGGDAMPVETFGAL